MDKIEAVIFDMDGLMFDTENLWINTTLDMAKNKGYDKITYDFMISNLGKTKEDIINNFNALNIPNFNVIRFREEYVEAMLKYIKINGVPIKKGLLPLLKYLKQKKIKTAIASSSGLGLILKYIQPCNLKKYFNIIVSGDDILKGKPNPEIFEKTVKALNVNCFNTIILEDSFNGIRAANSAGCKAVMIPDILQPNDEIKSLYYKKYDSLEQFLIALKENNI